MQADPAATARFLAAFFDELVRWGVRDVVVSPGSRSTPLAMTAHELARRSPQSLRVWVDVDERGAAFLALGLAKASGRPAAAVCTSGTAVANYYPAVMEAETSRVPLLLLTGDRPPRLQGLGAPQTCDQLHAFGTHVRAFRQMVLPADDAPSLAFARQAAREAIIAAGGQSAPDGEPRIAGTCSGGPVHLNFPFEEPLKPDFAAEGVLEGCSACWGGRPEGEPAAPVVPFARAAAALAADDARRLADALAAGPALVLAGEGTCATDEEAREVLAWARAFGLPLLADPLSGLRRFDDALVIDNYDSVLEPGGALPAHGGPGANPLLPRTIVRFGRYPISKKATQFAEVCACEGVQQVVVDPFATRDFNAATTAYAPCAPVDFARALTPFAGVTSVPANVSRETFVRSWADANEAARRRIVAVGAEPASAAGSFEGAYVRRAIELAPAGSCLFAANSMSVRAVDTFLTRGTRLAVLCNRGLNGIDGTVSTAVGAAQSFARTTLIAGDLTLLHDLNALALQRELRVQRALGAPAPGITIVLLNNNGGGIFDMLPQKSADPYFERLFLTPQDVDFGAAAAAFGVPYARAASVGAFDEAYRAALDVPGISLIEVPVPLSGVRERYGAYW